MTFQVVNTEGSVIVSCATTISLKLIQIHSELNVSVPICGKLIYSYADDLAKCKYKKLKSREDACGRTQLFKKIRSRDVKPKII